ncbi:glutathione S-transferase-like protein [Tamilnaduibacter salinus]|uniref:Glutathione S-transferase-like protein n=1 Tax=Tamilnaduibacter salinus TaxID=1484056 RepID=A0A2U1D0V5_9GAMM|nr:glutathione S-transferase N-terminal domain-containing protein [Tamilnaduibacter salinus]PVY79025.1 glutathione S-transferase-like protein [Tamilnaduibacter salinus]
MADNLTHNLTVLGSVTTSTLTAWRGCMVVKRARQPEKPLVLYDMEACPYCRRVREVLTALHLDADIRPCPKGGRRFRPEAEARGGKQLFPLLVDENTGAVLYESAAIVDYLFSTYGGRSVPGYYKPLYNTPVLGNMASAASALRGLSSKPSNAPAQPLHLWSFEGSPYSRLVRERLCELEIPYRVHNLGKEHWSEIGPAKRRLKSGPYQPKAGGKRDAFFQEHGDVMVPYLEDPNTGEAMFESADILDYLDRQYAV